jgi:hypothetical protein
MQHLIVPLGSCNSVTLGTAGLQSKPAPAWSRNRSIVYIGLQHVHAWAVKFARLSPLRDRRVREIPDLAAFRTVAGNCAELEAETIFGGPRRPGKQAPRYRSRCGRVLFQLLG